MQQTVIDTPRPVWASIDCSAIRHNFNLIRSHVGNSVKIMAVIKANAYGHGLVVVVRLLAKEGADAFGVARLCEAVQLRVHIKIDTGMGRLGLLATDGDQKSLISDQLQQISAFDSLLVEGIYTHFASADVSDLDSARRQRELFKAKLKQQELNSMADNLSLHVVLAAASKCMKINGIKVYHKARVSSVKHVPKGFSVSYQQSDVTQKETIIATIPIGYGDGYPRLLSSRGAMLVHGVRANVAGRVCMDQVMIDVGYIPDVCESDEVVLLGRQGENEISADEPTQATGTINYEVVSRILARVPRVYVN